MKKSEVLEIRRQFDKENSSISRISGCYVDAEKNIRTTFSDSFLTLPQEEELKYLEIFKKTLSGRIGKNLLNMEFPRDDNFENEKNEFLIKLRDSELKDEDLLRRLYEDIIGNYNLGGNYIILLVYIAYDVPGISSDGLGMDDASDEVYKHIVCSICPVELSKPALSYKPEENKIAKRNQDWIVEIPLNGFLFPAFNDRSPDISNMLFYSKNPKSIQEDFIESTLGCEVPLTAEIEKTAFSSIIEETLGEDCDYETVRDIHENLNAMLEESKKDKRPETIEKEELRTVFVDSGVESEKVEALERVISESEELSSGLHLSNLTSTSSFNISSPSISIKVSSDASHLVETRLIDGRKCIVIPVTEEVDVNGIPVKIKGK